ncbi:hypothetical protein F4677DRAFT_150802 [Hypoxylon crocopeplum]|nr:hypothetical protein F4677DRAFT_150802 [Hypoxylon crocopeplum]
MISDLGLLTREGMEFFYPVFKDMQNWMNPDCKDQFPRVPFPDKPKGAHAVEEYRKRLVEKGYTRVHQEKGLGGLIKVKAIGVWDTVGSLGIPQGKPREMLARLGINLRNQEYRFYNTRLSTKIEHGFHALALDETRGPFSPTLWERQPEYRDILDLRQVWFPGSHGNVGGGWADQGVANITLAWMLDQLASVGCEFVDDALERLYDRNVQYYHSLKPENNKREECAKCCIGCCGAVRRKGLLPWAALPIFDPNKPVRPWSLHSIQSVSSPIYDLAGKATRSPGLYKKINPENGRPSRAFLKDTNERIHSSVRVRLACEGLGLNDSDIWKCPALLQMWRPRRVAQKVFDPVPQNASWGPKDGESIGKPANVTRAARGPSDIAPTPSTVIYAAAESGTSSIMREDNTSNKLRWVWEYVGPDVGAPFVRMLMEENMGPWERHLLQLSTGKVHVCEYAEAQSVSTFKALSSEAFAKKPKSKKLKKPSP